MASTEEGLQKLECRKAKAKTKAKAKAKAFDMKSMLTEDKKGDANYIERKM